MARPGRLEATAATLGSSLFGIASLIQFNLIEMTVVPSGYVVQPLVAMGAGLIGYVVALVTPMGRRFSRLQSWETILVVGVPFVLLLHGLSETVQEFAAQSYVVGVVAWVICAGVVGVFLR